MINLTNIALKDPFYSPLKKWTLLSNPDLYRAFDMDDYLSGLEELSYPFHKRLFCKGSPRVYINLENVHVKALEDRCHFKVHDLKGEDIMQWSAENPFFTDSSSDITVEELLKGAWVANLVFRYEMEIGLPTITDIDRHFKDKGTRIPDSSSYRLRYIG
jgi:hypothetical protein